MLSSETRDGVSGIPPSYVAARAVLPPALASELCLTGSRPPPRGLSRALVGPGVPADEVSQTAAIKRARGVD